MTEAIRYGGFWRRFAALMIDAIVVYLFFLVLSIPVLGLIASQHVTIPVTSTAYMVISNVFYFSFIGLYYIFPLSSRWQGTFGKYLLNLRVLHAKTGGRISFKRSLCRYLAVVVPSIILAIGGVYGMVLETKNPQAIMPMEQQQQFQDYQQKMAEGTLSEEDKAKFQEAYGEFAKNAFPFMTFGVFAVFGFLYMLLNVLMVAFSHQKTAVHDLVCKTRVVIGRPDGVSS